MNYKPYIILGVVMVLVIGASVFAFQKMQGPGVPAGMYDTFAQCIRDSGAKFYGAFWCPHCQRQKGLFGTSVQYLPYIECSAPDGNNQLQVCKDANVTSYPTWEFAGGKRATGEQSFETLAQETGCALPTSPTPVASTTATQQ